MFLSRYVFRGCLLSAATLVACSSPLAGGIKAVGPVPEVVLRSGVLHRQKKRFHLDGWAYDRWMDLGGSTLLPTKVMRRINSAANALRLRHLPRSFWVGSVSGKAAPAAWRRFVAYQLFAGRARPGATLGGLARILKGCAWPRPREVVRVASLPASIMGALGKAFAIGAASPGEPGGRLLIALNARATPAQVCACLRSGGAGPLAAVKMEAIGLSGVYGVHRPRRWAVWLLAPGGGGRSQTGQTLDGWALSHYAAKVDAESGRQTPVRLLLRMRSMPAAFWGAIARGGRSSRPRQFIATLEIFWTDVTPGASLAAVAKLLNGAPWLRVADFLEIPGEDFPTFWSSSVEDGALYQFSGGVPPFGGSMVLSISRELTLHQLLSCLQGRGKKGWMGTRVLGVSSSTVLPK